MRTFIAQRSIRGDACMGYLQLSDGELVDGALAGNQEAWTTLVNRHSPFIFRVALVILDSGTDAHDACQDAWLAFDLKGVRGRQYDAQRPLKPYLARIVVRAALRIRTERSEQLAGSGAGSIERDPASADPSPGATAEENERRRVLMACIEKLPSRERLLVRLHLDGLSHSEIGERRGITEGNVRIAFLRAKRALRDYLISTGIES
jgi:RNA polymerase sigma-70 factor, ECF subfamily